MTKKTNIRPQEQNPNLHQPAGMGLLEGSIGRDGWIGAITTTADDETFDGSARVEVGAAAGWDFTQAMVIQAPPDVPLIIETTGAQPLINRRVDIPSTDDPRARRLSAAANQIPSRNYNPDVSLLAAWAEADPIIPSMWPVEAWAGMMEEINNPPDIAGAGDDFDPTPAEGPTRCQVGDLWHIGPHRLLVGDCTDPANVERLMGGERVRMVWTDPPYGVSYADKNDFLNALNRGNSNQTPIEHDHMSEEETELLATQALFMASKNALPGATCYVACPAGTLLPFFIRAVGASGFTFKHSLVWVKNQFVLGRCDYHYKHEMILYGWIENGAHYFVDDHTKFSVFEVDKPRDSDAHPTMKPIELVLQMIENSTRKSEIVYDPFLGSGTTLMAAHQTGRCCFGMEISCRYADVILRRAEAAHLPCVRQEPPHKEENTP